jgi:hypothetical protein
MKTDLEEIIQHRFKANRELSELLKMDDTQELGPPATKQAVATTEKKFGVQLPQDYRGFLLTHNGWKEFLGEVHLLSTQQMHDQDIREQVDSIAYSLYENGIIPSANVFIIQGSPTDPQIVFYDFASQAKQSSKLFHWDGGELHEFPSFTAYLEFSADVLDGLVKEERARFRKRKAKR